MSGNRPALWFWGSHYTQEIKPSFFVDCDRFAGTDQQANEDRRQAAQPTAAAELEALAAYERGELTRKDLMARFGWTESKAKRQITRFRRRA